MPAMIKVLKDDSLGCSAAAAIATFGPEAKTAIPNLIEGIQTRQNAGMPTAVYPTHSAKSGRTPRIRSRY